MRKRSRSPVIVGGINVSIPVAAPLSWTNSDQTTMVPRSQPLTVSWSGGPSGQGVSILGENSDLRTNSSAVFYCVAPPGATSFTIPPQVLAFVPQSRPNPLDSTGIIFVISSSSVSLTAKGVDVGLASSTYKTGKTVIFQ